MRNGLPTSPTVHTDSGPSAGRSLGEVIRSRAGAVCDAVEWACGNDRDLYDPDFGPRVLLALNVAGWDLIQTPGRPVIEPPAEHLRNALTVLASCREWETPSRVCYRSEDLNAAVDRICRAVAQLEGRPPV